MASSRIEVKDSIEIVKRKLGTNDGDVALLGEDRIMVSLLCPLTSTRIKSPARARNCDHLQCFDEDSFMQLNAIARKWKCPICKIFVVDLVIDSLFAKILATAPPSVTEAMVFADGGFEFAESSKDIECITVDSDDYSDD